MGESPGRIALTAGQCAVASHGSLDVLAVRDDGETMFVGAVEAGTHVFASTAPVQIVVLFDGETQVDVSVPSTDERAQDWDAFARLVAERLQTPQSPPGSPEEVASTLSAAMDTFVAERGAHHAATTAGEASATRDVLLVLQQAGEDLRLSHGDQDLDQLVRVVTYLGEVQGFTVPDVPTAVVQRAPDPVREVARRSGLRVRKTTLRSDWRTDLSTPILTRWRTEGTDRWVAVRRRGGRLLAREAGASSWRSVDALSGALTDAHGWEFFAPLPQGASSLRALAAVAMRPVRRDWTVAVLCGAAAALLALLTPMFTGFVIDVLIPQGQVGPLVQVGVVLGVAAGASFTLTMVQALASASIGQQAARASQAAVWSRLFELPVSFFRQFSSGDLTVRTLAVDSVQGVLNPQLVTSALAAVFGLTNLILMFVINPAFALVGLGLLLLAVAGACVLWWRTSAYADTALEASRSANAWLVQLLRGVPKLRVARATNRMMLRYLSYSAVQSAASARQTLIIGRFSAWLILLAALAPTSFFLLTGAQDARHRPLSTGEYMALSSAFALAFTALGSLLIKLAPLASARQAVEMTRPILVAATERSAVARDPGTLSGHLRLERVTYRYPRDTAPVLDGIDLTIEPGEFVALVGPSGAGKSTLLSLVLGFDEPEDGRVLFNDQDLRLLDPTRVRDQLGVVTQGGGLKPDSVLAHILGSEDADPAEAWRVAEEIGFADEIRAMPMQMLTLVSGQTVSGGQAQRIRLCRCLARRPAIVILDEATNSLDTNAEQQVMSALARLDVTRLVVAHRLSTVRDADRIVVLQDGRVVEEGAFERLIERQGVFARMVAAEV